MSNYLKINILITISIVLMLILACGACNSTIIKPPDNTDRASMPFTVDNIPYNGTASITAKFSFILKFSPPGNIVKFQLATCHREVLIDKPFEYQYIPVNYIENTPVVCPLIAKAIDDKGQITSAIIDFLFPNPKIKYANASVSCNGKLESKFGFFLCQVRSGLVQRITTDFLPTFAEATGDCPQPKKVDASSYEIIPGIGLCSILFGSNKSDIFRLDLYGYQNK